MVGPKQQIPGNAEKYAELRKKWDSANLFSKTFSPGVFFTMKREETRLSHAELLGALEQAGTSRSKKMESLLMKSSERYSDAGIEGMRKAVEDGQGELFEYMKLHKGFPKSPLLENAPLAVPAVALLLVPVLTYALLGMRASVLSKANTAKEKTKVIESMQNDLDPIASLLYYSFFDLFKSDGTNIADELSGIAKDERSKYLGNMLISKIKGYSESRYGKGTNYMDAIAYADSNGMITQSWSHTLGALARTDASPLLSSLKFQNYAPGSDVALAGMNGFDLLGKGQDVFQVVVRFKLDGEYNYVILQANEDNLYQSLFNAEHAATAKAENAGNEFGQKKPVIFVAGMFDRRTGGGKVKKEMSILTAQTPNEKFVSRAIVASGLFEERKSNESFGKVFPMAVKKGKMQAMQQTGIIAVPVPEHEGMVIGCIYSDETVNAEANSVSKSFDSMLLAQNRLWFGLSFFGSILGLAGMGALNAKNKRQIARILEQESRIITQRNELAAKDAQHADEIKEKNRQLEMKEDELTGEKSKKEFYINELRPFVSEQFLHMIINEMNQVKRETASTGVKTMIFGDIKDYSKLCEKNANDKKLFEIVNTMLEMLVGPVLERAELTDDEILRFERGEFAPKEEGKKEIYAARKEWLNYVLEKMPPKAFEKFGPLIEDYKRDALTKNFGIHLRKMIGDAIMLSEEEGKENTKKAIEALVMIEKYFPLFNEYLASNGLPPIAIRWGVHTGEMSEGVMGVLGNRLFPDVYGDSVNTAQRLEAACKELGTRMLMSDQTSRDVYPNNVPDGLLSREMGRLLVQGKDIPIDVREIFNGDREEVRKFKLETLEKFETAITLIKGYSQEKATIRNIGRAKGILEELVALHEERFGAEVDAIIKKNVGIGLWSEEEGEENRPRLFKEYGDKPLLVVMERVNEAFAQKKTDRSEKLMSRGAFEVPK